MYVEVLNTTITQDQAIKYEYKTTASQHSITGVLIATSSEKVEVSMYQENRSRPVFRKMDFGNSVSVLGLTIKQKKGYQPLNVSGQGNFITGIVKGLNVTGNQRIAILLEIDE